MNNLLDLTNAADPRAILETNCERIDVSLAFMQQPSLDLTGNPTALMGSPVAGTFVTGQLWVDVQCAIWRCTAGGTPGTWIQITPAIVVAYPSGTIPANYLVQLPSTNWRQFYWSGTQWLPVAANPIITADNT